MPINGLGAALRKLRDRRNLSIREVGKLAEIDYVYIHRLESGEKENPSTEIVARLLKVLKANEREAGIVKWLVDHSDAREDLVDLALEDESVDARIFGTAASIRHRGTARPDAATLIERARRLYEDLDE